MTASPTSLLKFALVGCGVVGRKRAAALQAGQLRYACDVDLRRAQALAEINEGCRALTDPQSAFADPAVDAVIVATINASLAPLARAAAQAGKHVLVEKPGAISSTQLREVHAAAEAARVRVQLGYNHRWHPGLRQAHALVRDGAAGPLMLVRGRYGHGGRVGYDREWRADPALSGGGELIDQGVHLIDLAGWFLGEFAVVEGHAVTSFWDMPVDDNAFLSLRTAAGQTAWLHVSCTEWKNLFSFEIYGRNGKIVIEGLGGSYGPERCTWYKMLPQMGPPEIQVWEYPAGDTSWALELAAFEAAVLANDRAGTDLAGAIRTLEIVEKIYALSGYPAGAAPVRPR